MNQFSKNFRHLRKLMKMTQQEVANQLNKKQSTIANWENDHSDPSVEDFIALRNFFGVSIDDLILSDVEKLNLSSFFDDKTGDGNIGQNAHLKPHISPHLIGKNPRVLQHLGGVNLPGITSMSDAHTTFIADNLRQLQLYESLINMLEKVNINLERNNNLSGL